MPDLCKYLLGLFCLKLYASFIYIWLRCVFYKATSDTQKSSATVMQPKLLNTLPHTYKKLQYVLAAPQTPLWSQQRTLSFATNIKIKLQQLFNKSKGELKKKQQPFWLCSGAVQCGLVLVHFGQREMSLSLSLLPSHCSSTRPSFALTVFLILQCQSSSLQPAEASLKCRNASLNYHYLLHTNRHNSDTDITRSASNMNNELFKQYRELQFHHKFLTRFTIFLKTFSKTWVDTLLFFPH